MFLESNATDFPQKHHVLLLYELCRHTVIGNISQANYYYSLVFDK